MQQQFFTNISFQRGPAYPAQSLLTATAAIFAVILLHIVVIYFFTTTKLPQNSLTINKYLDLSLALYGFVLVGFVLLYPVFVMLIVRPRRLISYLANGYAWHLLSKERLLFAYPVLMVVPLDMSVYSSFKTEIADIVPFWLDKSLVEIDRVLFAGSDPWRVLHPLIGDSAITTFIDFLYHPVWLMSLVCVILWHALGSHSLIERVRFFVSYIVIWGVLGNALALLLSSAGPCYFIDVTGYPGPYRDLMEYLNSVRHDGELLNAVRIQDTLWETYTSDVLAYGGGISAMPSLHIASTTLYALSFRRSHPWVARVFYLYTFVIWIGSIHLGWHYAVDGLVSVPLAFLVWILVGRLISRLFNRVHGRQETTVNVPSLLRRASR